MFHVSVRAIKSIDNKNGTFTLEVEGCSLNEQEAKTLEDLFPNTFNQIENLLATEALIGSVATDREVRSPEMELRQCYGCSANYRSPTASKYCPNCEKPVDTKKSVKQPLGKAFDEK